MNWIGKASASIAVFSLLLLAGCGGTPAPASSSPGPSPGGSAAPTPASQPNAAPANKKPVSIKVWTQFNDQEMAALQKIVDEWNAKTGNKGKVEATQGSFQEYATAAQAGNGPDLFLGMPHDNLGTFQKAGMLAALPDGLLDKSKYLPQSIDAVTYSGKQYGFPIAMEALAMFYNTDQIKDPPKDWDTFKKLADEKGFMFSADQPYFSWGFMAGYGAYVFKNTGNGLDVNDIGLNNDGAVQGLTLISDMIYKYRWMPKDVNDDVALGKFTAQKIGMYLSGSWQINGLKDAKVPFAIAPMPTLPNGQPFRPFVGFQTGFVNADSRHLAETWDLVKYMLGDKFDEFAVGAAHRIPVSKAGLERPDFKANAYAVAFAASALNGIPMPNVPEVSAAWPVLAQAMTVIAQGTLTPKSAADAMVDQLKKAIASSKS